MTTVYGDLVRYRELFGNLFRRDIQAKYRGSLLGLAWTLANPVLLMAVYLLVFSVLWLLYVVGDLDNRDAWWAGPIVLVVAGAAGLVAALRPAKDPAEPSLGHDNATW